MEDTRKPSRQMVEKLLQTQGLKTRLGDMFRGSITAFAVPLMSCGTTEEKTKRINDKIKDDDIAKEIVDTYARHFTASETLDMIAFFKSPAGQKYVTEAAKLSEDINTVMSRLTTRIVMEIIKDNVELMAREMGAQEEQKPDDFSEFDDPDKFDEIH